MTTYPTTPAAAITRSEIERLKRRTSEYNQALLLLNHAGYFGYTPGGGLLRAVEDALHAMETMRCVKDKIIFQLHGFLDANEDTIRRLRREIDARVARAEDYAAMVMDTVMLEASGRADGE